MESPNLKHAPMHAMRNKTNIALAQQCGCYSCLKVYPSNEIKEWTDHSETALCPYCHVDAVLPGVIDTKELQQIKDYWLS
jgi:hypothetical protein